MYDDDRKCQGHPAGEFDPMGQTVYCNGSCRRSRKSAPKKARAKRARRRDDDWTRERAMQAGMAFGCDGYNDEMGW